jgi:hypothetical protein
LRSAPTTTARASTSAAWIPATKGEFDPIQASRIREHNTYDLPLVCRTANNAFAIGEADLRDYGGLYLTGKGDGKAGCAGPRLAAAR